MPRFSRRRFSGGRMARKRGRSGMRFFRKRYGYRKGMKGGSLGRLWRAVKARKPELKMINFQYPSIEGTATTGAGFVGLVENGIRIPQGSTFSSRVGNAVKIKRLIYHFEVGATTTAATPYLVERFRLYLIEWKRNGPTQLITSADYALMQRTDNGLTTAQTPQCYYKLREAQQGRAHLMRTLKTMNAQITTSTAIDEPTVKWQKKRFRVVISYRGDGRRLEYDDGLSTTQLGWAHVLFMNMDGIVAWTAPQRWFVNGHVQIYFTDA